MMGCDGACAAGIDLVFKRDDKDWLKGTAILAIAVVAPVLLWLSALVCVD